MLRSLVGSEMCIRDRYQRRVRGGQPSTMPATGFLGRVHPGVPAPDLPSKLPLHSPYAMRNLIAPRREARGEPEPRLTRPLFPYGRVGKGGTDLCNPHGSHGPPETEHLVTYAPHSHLWCDNADTETRAQMPRLLNPEIVGSSYRVWTNMRNPEASGTPSLRHTVGETPSNAAVSCGFRRWRTLHDAVIGHDLAGLEKMIETGDHNPNQLGPTGGYSPLHIAVRYGGEPFVEALLKAGAMPDLQTDDGDTALHQCSKNGNEQMAQLLLDAGASTELTDINGWTALKLARFHGHKRVAAVIQGAPEPVPPRGSGVWPQQATGQQHPLATAEEVPARIRLVADGVGSAKEADSNPNPDPDETSCHAGGHSHGNQEVEDPARKVFPLGNEGQRSPLRQHGVIPEHTRSGPQNAKGRTGGQRAGTPADHSCFVMNYAQPEQFVAAERQKAQDQKAFWFKYFI
eukprot:TRINITY_DN49484_c0_g1_i1.p1 TRINITY_DN49484_c0_g1~~TRINITY_DN49484_c0_g1_i1.p1  ORF type:complete len:458 (-),score=67.12 TRINITY_DN49484_c0_g1_i1:324-1697(-)